MSRFDPAHKEKLHSEERKKVLPPEKILEMAGVREGQTVIDFGCGNGYLTIPLAEVLKAGGKVIAVDISIEMLDDLKNRLSQELKNVVEFIHLEKLPLPLKDSIADLFFAVNVLHETEKPAEVLKEAYRVLKNKAKIAVVEWKKEPTPHGPPLSERFSEEELSEVFGKEGLRVIGKHEFSYHYLLLGEKIET